MKAFITGSQVYGEPKDESDIDLVIFCDDATLDMLTEQADELDKRSWGEKQKSSDCGTIKIKSLRFGNLNIIACTDDKRYASFLLGTEVLKARARASIDDCVPRDTAVELLTSLRNME